MGTEVGILTLPHTGFELPESFGKEEAGATEALG